jgi:hypothetical protein
MVVYPLEMKISTLLFLLACSTAARSQQTTIVNQAPTLGGDTICQITVASYHCLSSSFLNVTVRKECGEYVAHWRKSYGKISLQKPSSGTISLSGKQFSELNKLAEKVSPAATHKENCNGTTYFKFKSEGFNKEQRLCDCGHNVWSELFTMIKNSKDAIVQHQL